MKYFAWKEPFQIGDKVYCHAPSTGSALPDQTPWNYPLFKLMADEHGLTLTDDDLNQIINTVREMDQPNARGQVRD